MNQDFINKIIYFISQIYMENFLTEQLRISQSYLDWHPVTTYFHDFHKENCIFKLDLMRKRRNRPLTAEAPS